MDWPRAWGDVPASASLKWVPEDFCVEECLELTPQGSGEHLWLWVQKRDRNTADVAREVARAAGVAPRAVSWSGLKDRRALTRQWLSVHLPRREDACGWRGEGWEVLSASRHGRKLRVGTHRENAFALRLRTVRGDREALAARLEVLAQRGVPNYFGEQRFGRDAGNIDAARAWLQAGRPRLGRQRQSLYLSALRALLFNRVLAERVRSQTWCTLLPGDVLMLDGSRSVFAADTDATLPQRLERGDVHVTGPLCGRPAGLLPEAQARRLEECVLASEAELTEGLAAAGVDAARRSLRLLPRDLRAHWQGTDLMLEFRLSAGCFATTVVRELIGS